MNSVCVVAVLVNRESASTDLEGDVSFNKTSNGKRSNPSASPRLRTRGTKKEGGMGTTWTLEERYAFRSSLKGGVTDRTAKNQPRSASVDASTTYFTAHGFQSLIEGRRNRTLLRVEVGHKSSEFVQTGACLVESFQFKGFRIMKEN